MSTLLLALISLGISAGVVLSSFVWWTSYRGGTLTSAVDSESHGFPVAYYSVVSTYRLPRTDTSVPITIVQDLDKQTLTVDILVIFILCLGILTVLRWRALRSIGRRGRPRFSTQSMSLTRV